jgi:hypothetical protein
VISELGCNNHRRGAEGAEKAVLKLEVFDLCELRASVVKCFGWRGIPLASFTGGWTSKKQGKSFMDGFLLLALVLVYLAISYGPVSEPQRDTYRDERASQRIAEMDGARRG